MVVWAAGNVSGVWSVVGVIGFRAKLELSGFNAIFELWGGKSQRLLPPFIRKTMPSLCCQCIEHVVLINRKLGHLGEEPQSLSLENKGLGLLWGVKYEVLFDILIFDPKWVGL